MFFDLIYTYSIRIIKIISKDFLIYIQIYVLKLFHTKQKI